MQALSLYELNEFVRRITALNFPDAVWVKAEIAQYGKSRGNHYINLVEKEEHGDTIIAESEAVIWAGQYYRLASKMDIPIKNILQEGMEVLFRVQPEFHERYGFKLIIREIDAAFTVGKLALARKKIIDRLDSENLLHKNGQIQLPPVIQHIAILSTDTAAGYQDFMEQLSQNRFGYTFKTRLFKTAMQGEHTVKEAVQNLKKIRRSPARFDCVVIIRGGGARLTLRAFDDYDLSKAVAEFPLPVLSGIGHERDESVLDMVAHSSLKTPTAVAEAIIQHNFSFENELYTLGRALQITVKNGINDQLMYLKNAQSLIKHKVVAQVGKQQERLNVLKNELPRLVVRKLKSEKKALEYSTLISNLLNMESILGRGYSLTTDKKGGIINSTEQLKAGTIIQTRLKSGRVESEIKKIKK